MSKVATVENATPNPRQMIARKYFTFVPSTYRRIFTFERRLWPDKIAAPRSAAARPATGTAIADGHIAEDQMLHAGQYDLKPNRPKFTSTSRPGSRPHRRRAGS